LDSTFCKRCGTTLPDEDLAIEKQKLDDTVREGVRLFNEGHSAEAMAIAETAVVSDPTHAQAWSLKGMAHERMGQIAEALDCYEKVVGMNPDSALDKLKLNHLRNQLANQAKGDPKPKQRALLIAAAAAVVLFATSGAIIAVIANNQQQALAANTAKGNTSNEALLQPFDTGQSNPTQTATTNQAQNPVQANPNTGTANPNPGPQNPAPDPTNAIRNSDNSNQYRPSYRATRDLPGVYGQPTEIEGSIRPVTVSIRPDGSEQLSPNRNSQSNLDPDPTPAENSQSRETANTAPTEPDPGIIEIRASGNQSPRNTGDSPRDSANGATALVRTAQSQFLSGNLEGATQSYRRALQYGADSGSVNQRLGQAYERMGKRREALNAYQEAQSALERKIKAGGGDRGRNEAALESVKRSIKILQGG
jgi:tetratricopeptide (TPR) repeat protein